MIPFLDSSDQIWRIVSMGLGVVVWLQLAWLIKFHWRTKTADGHNARLFIIGVLMLVSAAIYAQVEQLSDNIPVASRTYFVAVAYLFMSVSMTVTSRQAFNVIRYFKTKNETS